MENLEDWNESAVDTRKAGGSINVDDGKFVGLKRRSVPDSADNTEEVGGGIHPVNIERIESIGSKRRDPIKSIPGDSEVDV